MPVWKVHAVVITIKNYSQMKKLTRIHLHNLSQAELAKREENLLKGGINLPCVCVVACTCKYAGAQEGPNDSFYGGSSKDVSDGANQPGDLGVGSTF